MWASWSGDSNHTSERSHSDIVRMTNLYRMLREGWRLLPPGVRGLDPVRRFTQPIAGAFREHNQSLYHSAYFDTDVEPAAARASKVITESICRDLKPSSVIDLGCGTGALLAELAKRGVDTMGLEYSDAAVEIARARNVNVRKFDVRFDSVETLGRFDVVCCTEVAEHVPGKFAARLVGSVTSLARIAVFTAATPGQGGVDHVNEQPHDYWIEKFAKAGYDFDSQRSAAWRAEWRQAGIQDWYWKNVMIFSTRA